MQLDHYTCNANGNSIPTVDNGNISGMGNLQITFQDVPFQPSLNWFLCLQNCVVAKVIRHCISQKVASGNERNFPCNNFVPTNPFLEVQFHEDNN